MKVIPNFTQYHRGALREKGEPFDVPERQAHRLVDCGRCEFEQEGIEAVNEGCGCDDDKQLPDRPFFE